MSPIVYAVVGVAILVIVVAIIALGYAVSGRKPVAPELSQKLHAAARRSASTHESATTPTPDAIKALAGPLVATSAKKSTATKKETVADAASVETTDPFRTLANNTADGAVIVTAVEPAAAAEKKEQKAKEKKKTKKEKKEKNPATVPAPAAPATPEEKAKEKVEGDEGGKWQDAKKEKMPLVVRQQKKIESLERDLRRAREETDVYEARVREAKVALLKLEKEKAAMAAASATAPAATEAPASAQEDALRELNYVNPSKERLLKRELDQVNEKLAAEREARAKLEARVAEAEAKAKEKPAPAPAAPSANSDHEVAWQAIINHLVHAVDDGARRERAFEANATREVRRAEEAERQLAEIERQVDALVDAARRNLGAFSAIAATAPH